MWEKLKHAANAVKAWGAGVGAYVTTLFSTPGTFGEASQAASNAYGGAYRQSMDNSEPSISGAARTAAHGNLGQAAQQVGDRVGNFLNSAAESLSEPSNHRVTEREREARQAERAREEAAFARQQEALLETQATRREVGKANRQFYRDKYHLPDANQRENQAAATTRTQPAQKTKKKVIK